MERNGTHPADAGCDRQLYKTLVRVGEAIGVPRCFAVGGRYYFPLGAGTYVLVAPESAARLRLEACISGRAADTMWAQVGDEDRVERVVLKLAEGVRAPA